MNQEQQAIVFFTQNIKDNYSALQSFYEYEFMCFCELRTVIYSNLNCLLLGLYIPSICTTNYLLERMMKLALYTFEMKGHHIGDDDFLSKMTMAKNQYDNKQLYDTIKLAHEKGIITDEEKESLDKLRCKLRNPYSHAELGKIISEVPSSINAIQVSTDKAIDELQAQQQISYTGISTPSYAIADFIQGHHAIFRAKECFVDVFNIMVAIDKRYRQ